MCCPYRLVSTPSDKSFHAQAASFPLDSPPRASVKSPHSDFPPRPDPYSVRPRQPEPSNRRPILFDYPSHPRRLCPRSLRQAKCNPTTARFDIPHHSPFYPLRQPILTRIVPALTDDLVRTPSAQPTSTALHTPLRVSPDLSDCSHHPPSPPSPFDIPSPTHPDPTTRFAPAHVSSTSPFCSPQIFTSPSDYPRQPKLYPGLSD